ncbi:hypothetical protein QYE76_024003 [Lolium multiflorum]|uniref:Retrotransposon Copia-like N-terminal domain-containing protein n=1 Tax=Lolium multiflorum TaxID=4521 RepID=A0AAD8VUN7_LOLMU|nr:hypothetical protein QYE76_024003 [Lolium multiflorum]
MTPDEIAAKERELEARAKALDDREASINQQILTATNAAAVSLPAGQTPSPNPNPTEPTTTSPSTYATSIKLHVPITLSLTDGNYTSWRELFLVALGRYGLTAHVTGEATPSDTSPTSAWGRDDYTVLSWIYGSIDTDLLGIVMRPGSTALTIWDAIENLFRDNKKHRAIQLEADFRNTPQGDLSISDYCAKLKNLADSLTDVGQPISDETLVLTLLRGLNDTYAHLRSFLPFQVPFPSFLQTRSALILEETQRRTDARNAASTALWAMGQSVLPNNGGARAPPSGDRSSSAPFGGDRAGGRGTNYFTNTFRGGGRGRGSGRGRGRGRDNPWQFNPWTGAPTRAQLQQAPWQPPPSTPWQPRSPTAWQPPSPGLLGPRPSMTPQAYTAQGSYVPTTHQQQQIDPALLAALNNLQLPGSDWHMDTGASSHMASDPGRGEAVRRGKLRACSIWGAECSFYSGSEPGRVVTVTMARWCCRRSTAWARAWSGLGKLRERHGVLRTAFGGQAQWRASRVRGVLWRTSSSSSTATGRGEARGGVWRCPGAEVSRPAGAGGEGRAEATRLCGVLARSGVATMHGMASLERAGRVCAGVCARRLGRGRVRACPGM